MSIEHWLRKVLAELVTVFLGQELSLLLDEGRVRQVAPLGRVHVEVDKVGGRRQPPRDWDAALEETNGVGECNNTVEVVVGGAYPPTVPLHGGDGLLVGPLDLDVDLGLEVILGVIGNKYYCFMHPVESADFDVIEWSKKQVFPRRN